MPSVIQPRRQRVTLNPAELIATWRDIAARDLSQRDRFLRLAAQLALDHSATSPVRTVFFGDVNQQPEIKGHTHLPNRPAKPF